MYSVRQTVIMNTAMNMIEKILEKILRNQFKSNINTL